MRRLRKVLRGFLYVLPLLLCILGILLCVGAMIDYRKAVAQANEKMDKFRNATVPPGLVVIAFPLLFITTITYGFVLLTTLGLYFLGGFTLLAGLLVSLLIKKAPLDLRRAEILLNGSLLVIVVSIYLCGYFS
jgi:hypothetical protein